MYLTLSFRVFSGLFLFVATMYGSLFPTNNLTNFEMYCELKKCIEGFENNPSNLQKSQIKKTIFIAMKAIQNNDSTLKLLGLLTLRECIKYDDAFEKFSQVLGVVRKAIKNTDVQIRCAGIVVLQEVVRRYTKIDEIKEEALSVTHTAIKSCNEQERCDGFYLYCAVLDRDKEFNQFDDLAQTIDKAVQSTDEDIHASGIWLLCKHIKRNLRFADFKKANEIAKIGMTSSHRGMRCHTSALLSILIHKELCFSELPKIRRFAIEEVSIAIANKDGKDAATFVNSVSLLSGLMARGIDFEKQEYVVIQQAVLLGLGHVNAKAWANSLGMLIRLIEQNMSTIPMDKLTSVVLQAMESNSARVLSEGLQLLRFILVNKTEFTQFEAAEKAALRYAEYDNTWVRRRAIDVLIELIQKGKLRNCALAEHVAQRSAHSSNDEEHRAGRHLLDFITREKYKNVFLFAFLAGAFLALCCFVGSWWLNRIRSKKLSGLSKFGHRDWYENR